MFSISPIEASSAADPNVKPPAMVGVDPAEENGIERPVVEDTGEKHPVEGDKDFLQWVKDKLNGLKGWFGGLIGTTKVDSESGEKNATSIRTEDGQGG
jgi:hypothetical protein